MLGQLAQDDKDGDGYLLMRLRVLCPVQTLIETLNLGPTQSSTMYSDAAGNIADEVARSVTVEAPILKLETSHRQSLR